jgi:CMP-N-acetylneuraminic acid synthetase
MAIKARPVAIIPARGGSKRIPHKNIVDFCGKPLIAWTIEAALESTCFDRVVVSTDDARIAEVAAACGAQVPFLREAHADDHSTVSMVAIHTLDQLEAKLGLHYETVASLQATSPLRNAEDIRTALASFAANDAPTQMSCFKFHWATPWWAFERNSGGNAAWLHPEMIEKRSQDHPPLFGLTGAICIGKTTALRAQGSFYGPLQRYEPISWQSAIDIDDPEDLAFAEAVYAQMRATRPR